MYKIFNEEQVKELHAFFTSEKMQSFLSSAKKKPEGAVEFEMVISSEDVDRMGEVIKVDGWDLTNYLANPVVLFAHDYRSLPVGITTKLFIKNKQLIAQGYFAPADANPVAGQLAKLYELGLLKTASVGFMPKETDKEDEKIITKQELLEWSFTPVPANPFALTTLGQAKLAVASYKGLIVEEKTIADTGELKAEEKGDVADQLSDEKKREMKYTNLRAVFDIVYAMCDVYMEDEKNVEDFAPLLKETAALLLAMAESATVEAKSALEKKTKELDGAGIEKLFELIEKITSEKAGRVLSAKNKKLILGAAEKADAMAPLLAEVSQSLKDLVASAESDEAAVGGEGKATHSQSGTGVEHLMNAQSVLRSVANAVQTELRNVNETIKKGRAD